MWNFPPSYEYRTLNVLKRITNFLGRSLSGGRIKRGLGCCFRRASLGGLLSACALQVQPLGVKAIMVDSAIPLLLNNPQISFDHKWFPQNYVARSLRSALMHRHTGRTEAGTGCGAVDRLLTWGGDSSVLRRISADQIYSHFHQESSCMPS